MELQAALTESAAYLPWAPSLPEGSGFYAGLSFPRLGLALGLGLGSGLGLELANPNPIPTPNVICPAAAVVTRSWAPTRLLGAPRWGR